VLNKSSSYFLITDNKIVLTGPELDLVRSVDILYDKFLTNAFHVIKDEKFTNGEWTICLGCTRKILPYEIDSITRLLSEIGFNNLLLETQLR